MANHGLGTRKLVALRLMFENSSAAKLQSEIWQKRLALRGPLHHHMRGGEIVYKSFSRDQKLRILDPLSPHINYEKLVVTDAESHTCAEGSVFAERRGAVPDLPNQLEVAAFVRCPISAESV